MNAKNWIAAAIWAGTLLVFALTIYFVRIAAEPKGSSFEFASGVKNFGGPALWNVAGAFLIGALGSAAFLMIVATAIVEHPSRDNILKNVTSTSDRTALYIFLGGIIAGVFQLAEASAFAPVQALVIGVTWPSVISQYLGSKPDGHARDFKEIAPAGTAGNVPALP